MDDLTDRSWTWKCPYDGCQAHGMKAVTWMFARDYGRNHIVDCHGSSDNCQNRLKPLIVKAETILKNSAGPAKRYTWKCPIRRCGGRGWKPLKKRSALRYGREHMKRIHGDSNINAIVAVFNKRRKRKNYNYKKRKQDKIVMCEE
jgi:hypothetical protein